MVLFIGGDLFKTLLEPFPGVATELICEIFIFAIATSIETSTDKSIETSIATSEDFGEQVFFKFSIEELLFISVGFWETMDKVSSKT